MTKAELLKALEVGPDDAEIVVADMVGADIDIDSVIYFAKEKLFWIRPTDMVDDDEVALEDEPVAFCGAPTEAPEVCPVPEVLKLPRGRQRAA